MQKRILAATIAGAGLMGLGAFAANDPRDELVKMEANWSKAIVARDVAAVGAIVAPDWAGQGSDGTLSNKVKMLADMKKGVDTSTSMVNRDVHVRIIGDLAIVQGSDDEKSKHNGKDSSGAYTWTDVFQKRAGHWLVIASQSTPVTKK
jgi:ketosteroid isomerase-like protein